MTGRRRRGIRIALPLAGADGQGLGGSLHRLPDLILVTTCVSRRPLLSDS
jgi:hypothetical protein